ncbi:MAG TPA: 50S ribosomal protein L21e [archaeon]|nr:50S ribosomal protein L21e [archaeon]
MANKKARGKRAKTRSKLTRRYGSLTINKILPDFETGQTVQIVIDSSVHSGIPSHRFQGLTGNIFGKQGKVYKVAIKNGNQPLEIFVHPAHLKPIKTIFSEKTIEKVAA